ncbi:substrate-binding periplasmic protein [Piscirickettsia litoralis]|uniref:Solute-binding protein family 3/N-terminal domain-containing protein n=1 Tax=Piscirickettsia litoralis TaxID=1891921 RepID=A0ABX2ZY61_9GAMM|nr:transporter substrate-binding domain-containing protein [Piscirickettsia litoralis]ODN41428.1 hypothetical protein BGC07_16835 [Piscirickettsia litoralis]
MPKLLLVICFVSTFLIANAFAFRGTVKVCGVEWPPFTYNKNGKLTKGISIAIYTEAFKRMNMTLDADTIPWARCLDAVKEGQYMAVIDNAALPPFIFGKHPTGIYPLAIYTRENYPLSIFSWRAMWGKPVGMVRGYDYTPKIKRFRRWQPDYSDSDEQALQKLNAHRYDFVVMDIFAAPLLASKLKINIKRLTPMVDGTYLYLVFNKKHQRLLQEYDKKIKQMIEDGTIDNIYLDHINMTYSELMSLMPDN